MKKFKWSIKKKTKLIKTTLTRKKKKKKENKKRKENKKQKRKENQKKKLYPRLFQYVILGQNRWLPHRLRHDMIWNPTANITGGIAKNVSLDYAMEKENRGFQGWTIVPLKTFNGSQLAKMEKSIPNMSLP